MSWLWTILMTISPIPSNTTIVWTMAYIFDSGGNLRAKNKRWISFFRLPKFETAMLKSRVRNTSIPQQKCPDIFRLVDVAQCQKRRNLKSNIQMIPFITAGCSTRSLRSLESSWKLVDLVDKKMVIHLFKLKWMLITSAHYLWIIGAWVLTQLDNFHANPTEITRKKHSQCIRVFVLIFQYHPVLGSNNNSISHRIHVWYMYLSLR